MAAESVTVELRKAESSASFWAVAGDRRAVGQTPGEALDLLLNELPESSDRTILVLPRNRPDSHFTAEQIARLEGLRSIKAERPLTDEESDDYLALVDAELRGTEKRAANWPARS
jgi:hypothetical protein